LKETRTSGMQNSYEFWLTFNMTALGINVLAFEPLHRNIELINQTLHHPENIERGISRRVKLFPYGLGHKDTNCTIISGKKNYGDDIIKCSGDERDMLFCDKYEVRSDVPIRRLDDHVVIRGLNIIGIKIDTEGFEAYVLEGGKDVIINGGAVLIETEFQSSWIEERGGDPKSY
jgi:FkbM family methyltransferase